MDKLREAIKFDNNRYFDLIGKPVVFIGSTREAEGLLKMIEQFFDKALVNIIPWNMDEGLWPPISTRNGGEVTTSQSLINFLDVFDFGVFLFTLDDKYSNEREPLSSDVTEMLGDSEVVTDGAKRQGLAVRSNVIFEYALFLGRLGKGSSFAIATKEAERYFLGNFTDLSDDIKYYADRIKSKLNIKYVQSVTQEAIKQNTYTVEQITSLKLAVSDIQANILKDFSSIAKIYFPSTALAIGYFENFIGLIIKKLGNANSETKTSEKVLLFYDKNGIEHDAFENVRNKPIEINIVLPPELDQLPNDFSNLAKLKTYSKIIEGRVPMPDNRSISIFFLNEKLDDINSPLKIYDLPTTLISTYYLLHKMNSDPNFQELIWIKDIRSFVLQIRQRQMDERYLEILSSNSVSLNIIPFVDLKMHLEAPGN